MLILAQGFAAGFLQLDCWAAVLEGCARRLVSVYNRSLLLHIASESFNSRDFYSLLPWRCQESNINQCCRRSYPSQLCSCSCGHINTNLLISGIGVGDSDASATSALILTVFQDSMGRIATILFAHRLGTALEPECKMYRLAADIFNDAAMLFDCLSPALPKASRVCLLSLSSILRALCGVAAGSSKASLSAHFATQGNLGELNAVSIHQRNFEVLLTAY